MAEPAGIFIEIDVDEKGVKKILNHKFEDAKFGKKLGYYFSELLFDRIENPANVFLFNYDKKNGKCFIAYLLDHFEEDAISNFPKILEILSKSKVVSKKNYAVVMTTFPNVLYGYEITDTVQKIPPNKVSKNSVTDLFEKFWSFSTNNDFPEPQQAFNKRNYFYKNFKNYYTKYLSYIEERLKPQRIAEATKENPYRLFQDFYTYENKVFEFRGYTNQIIELPNADPLTFGSRGYCADKNHVYNLRLAKNLPPKDIKQKNGTTNNPKAIWEWYIVEGIDGGSYEYIKEKWDTLYFRDKNSIFYGLEKIQEADRDSFEYLTFAFGRDKNHVFFRDKIIPINTNHFKLQINGFIYDKKNIFHYESQLFLDAETFKVIEHKEGTNSGVVISGLEGNKAAPVNGTFILEDKNGKYEYNADWKEEKLKLITSYK